MNNKTILAHGKFDVLHIGHISHLKEAKDLGDKLIVSITADTFLKTPPRFTQEERKEALELLPWVDEVYICSEPTGLEAIKKFKPSIYVKGPDYKNGSDSVFDLEIAEVEKYGGEVQLLTPKFQFSSTKLKADSKTFKSVNFKEIGLQTVKKFIEEIKDVTPVIIGENIADIFQEVELDGQSAKSYCPAFTHKGDQIVQEGGALIGLRHIQNFCDSVYWIGNENPVKKLRFLDTFNGKKHMEFKRIPSDIEQEVRLTNYLDGPILLMDYGHGLLNPSKTKLEGPLYTMVQTNSSNYGFNLASKWNKFVSELVCLDRTEASLLINEKIEYITKPLMKKICSMLNTISLIVTMHKYGSVYYNSKTDEYVTFPGLANEVVDTIGAGDAFFVLASLAHYKHFKPLEILFIASLGSALTTQWLCNEKSVTPEELLNLCKIVTYV